MLMFLLNSTLNRSLWKPGAELLSCLQHSYRRLLLVNRNVFFAQLKAELSLVSSTLEDTRINLGREGAARSQLDLEVSALRLDRERDLRDLRAANSAELTAAREDGVRRAEAAAAARSSEVRSSISRLFSCVVARVQPTVSQH